MALPKVDTPVYDIILPLSKKKLKFRPFLVKEQKNLLMAMEADDKETIEKNIKQVLTNCTLNDELELDQLPLVDVEYYFLQLRSKSVGDMVENTYICNNMVGDKKCGNKMKVLLDLDDIVIENLGLNRDMIKISDNISVKLKYPDFSTIQDVKESTNSIEASFDIVIKSIEYIFDGEEYYYASEHTRQELKEFIESLNQDQFLRIEQFFENLPKIKKRVDIKCDKCGYDHSIDLEGLENFFG